MSETGGGGRVYPNRKPAPRGAANPPPAFVPRATPPVARVRVVECVPYPCVRARGAPPWPPPGLQPCALPPSHPSPSVWKGSVVRRRLGPNPLLIPPPPGKLSSPPWTLSREGRGGWEVDRIPPFDRMHFHVNPPLGSCQGPATEVVLSPKCSGVRPTEVSDDTVPGDGGGMGVGCQATMRGSSRKAQRGCVRVGGRE